MIDKKTEADIKEVRDFLEFWTKFHSIYADTISKEIISKEDEGKFLETRDVIKIKYDELKGALEFKYAPRSRLTDPVNDILGMETVRLVSERNLRRLEENWRDSYIFLNSILERYKNKKRRLEAFNPVGVFFKRVLERKSYS